MTRAALFLLSAGLLAAHPMGNFSVSHYTRLEVSPRGVEVTYALDLGEVPAYLLLRDWKLNPKSSPEALETKAAEQARAWAQGLEFRTGSQPVQPRFVRADIQLSPSPDGQFTAKVTSVFELDSASSPLTVEDRNFTERPGWKEIVIRARAGVAIVQASQGEADRSNALSEYVPGSAPQDLRAAVEWKISPAVSQTTPRIVPIEQPAPVVPAAAATPPVRPEAAAKGDFLSRLVAMKQIPLVWLLAGLVVAFGFGAAHALTPGHGKTIVAAYLVGSRGTMKHAVFLGAMVTFTHTISVFLLGLGVLFLADTIKPEKITPILGVVSGLSIVAVGASLFYKRLLRLQAAGEHSHDDHSHNHHHHHDHDHDHHHHHHEHDHAHDHVPHTHSHVPDGDITLGSLIALGASGGLVPCPSALVLLLASISFGHVGAGLVLLVAFSLGLAGVLMAIGMMVLYAKNWLPDPAKTSQHPAFRLIPVLSAAVIVCIGLVMTGVSLGWVRPGLAG